MSAQLSPVVAAHIAAINAGQVDAILATFAPDAFVNDNRREIVGDHVTMEVQECIDHYGDVIMRARYDGTYDKTNLPPELILTNYFTLRDDKIVGLVIVFNQPSPY